LRNITCQNSILDLEKVVNDGKVLLFYLGKGRFGDFPAGLLASQIVSRIRHAIFKRRARKDARPFYLYADEFQMFADERFSELLAEARKFRLSLTIAHQYAGQLEANILQGILGNVGTMIVFRVGAPDGELLEPIFQPYFNRKDLSSIPNFRACAISFGTLGGVPFSLELPATLGTGDIALAEKVRDISRSRFGRSREIVEAEINSTHQAYNEFSRPRNKSGGI